MSSQTAQAAIANLKDAGLSDVLHLPDTPAYEERTSSYWSLTAQLRPWVIVQPRTTEEVSKALTALVKTPDCKFAVRRLVLKQMLSHTLVDFSCYLLLFCLFRDRTREQRNSLLTPAPSTAAATWPGPAPTISQTASPSTLA